MKKYYLFITLGLTLFTLFCSSTLFSKKTTLYIDSLSGMDTNKGTTPETAWKSLSRLKQSSLKAGDHILLKAGQTFYGSLNLNNIKGTKNLSLLVSSYGDGKATIVSNDSAAIIISNCDWVKVSNFILKGSGRLSGNTSNGLEFNNVTNGQIENMDVSGYLFSGVQVKGGSDINISHVYAHDNGFSGIYVDSFYETTAADSMKNLKVKRVYIGYSVAENNPGCPVIKDNHSGNGILLGGTSTALIEYCEAMNNGWDMPREGNGPVGIWAYESDQIIIQHCYSHHNKTSATGADGGGFDLDGGMTNSILQYNLSAYNEGAGYGMFQYADADYWHNNIVRYNISYNDGWKNGQCGIFMWCDPAAVPMKNLSAYNNTIVNNYKFGVNFLPGDYQHFVFENNIFLVTAESDQFVGGSFSGAVFDNNLYWNSKINSLEASQPEYNNDLHALYRDPVLWLPESDSDSLKQIKDNNLNYFQLQSNSPCLNAGKIIQDCGDKDFWGNDITLFNKPNLGADGKKIIKQ